MEADRAERYFDSQAWVYNASRRYFLRGRSEAIEALGLEKEHAVVEFGCGTGMNFRHIYEAGVTALSGVDTSRGMLKRAKRRYPAAKLIHADFVEEKTYLRADRVLCSYVLSLITRWERALVNMKETLRPGGVLVVLDYIPMKGVLRPFDPIFRWWIGIHGADPTRPVAPFLQKHFRNVMVIAPRSGYYQVVRASGPRLSDDRHS